MLAGPFGFPPPQARPQVEEMSAADVKVQEALHEVGIVATKSEGGKWEIRFENDLPAQDSMVIEAMGTTSKPGPLRGLKVSKIDLYDSEVSSKGIELLCELKDVEEFVLSGTRVNEKGMKALATLPKLTFLMPGLGVDDKALKALSGHPTLHSLDLQTASIGDEGIEYLRTLKQLKFLDISNQSLSAKGLRKLRELPALEFLCFRSAGLKDSDLEALSEIKGLKTLYLDFNDDLDGSGFEKVSGLASLEVLGIYQVPFEARYLKHLNRLTKLKTLRLWGIRQRFRLDDLAALKDLKDLEEVVVGEHKKDEVVEKNLKAIMPKVTVKYLGE